MTVFHDEIEIEDFEYDEETEIYHFPCPCGDRFEISQEDLMNGEDVATCPSCSLVIKVIYDIKITGVRWKYCKFSRPSERHKLKIVASVWLEGNRPRIDDFLEGEVAASSGSKEMAVA